MLEEENEEARQGPLFHLGIEKLPGTTLRYVLLEQSGNRYTLDEVILALWKLGEEEGAVLYHLTSYGKPRRIALPSATMDKLVHHWLNRHKEEGSIDES